MREALTAAPFVPERPTLRNMSAAVQECRGCDLYKYATQAVFGEGESGARMVLVGEQPGDSEDKEGAPFVGPAGRLLDKALAEAQIDRSLVYVTNAVKHFKHEVRGKRRIHKKPSAVEVRACQPWLEAEIRVIRPDLIVCLGATAAQSVIGRTFKITEQRGVLLPHAWSRQVMATVHPSALLRIPERDRREEEFGMLVRDLNIARSALT